MGRTDGSDHLNMLRLLLIVAVVCSVNAAFNYCTLSPQHTLCRFKVGVYGTACTKVFPIIISPATKAALVAYHNDIRRRVAKGLVTAGRPGPQPPASNMRQLVWDEELALIAQTWANQCTPTGDVDRNVQRFGVSQNLYYTLDEAPNAGFNWATAINLTAYSWFWQVNNMDRTFVLKYPGTSGIIGYTNMVGAEATAIGCGIMRYLDQGQPATPYRTLYVCNYGKGNVMGSPLYRVGTPGTACPAGTVNSNGLCA